MRFSGHESFHCRSLWLKKGIDHLDSGYDFAEDAPILLGVGRNMVTSINYWIKSFNLVNLEDEKIKPIAKKLFFDGGWDPYLEDEGTLWLLHFWLVTNDYASIYSLLFNELRKRKPLFTLNNFKELIVEKKGKVSPNSLKTDFHAFTRTYVSKGKTKDLDESYSGVLTELNLVKEHKLALEIEPSKRPEIPLHILLFCILESNKNEKSLSFDRLYAEPNSVGTVFALSREGLNELLEGLSTKFDKITYSNEAGIRELQFKKNIDSRNILTRYYEN
jgi:uncharacterized protein DUF4007